MPNFQKGNPGKPKGAKEHKWASINYWFEKLQGEWANLTPNQRASYSVELMKLLANKAKALPLDPDDSAFNAERAMKTLHEIESKAKPSTETGSKTL